MNSPRTRIVVAVVSEASLGLAGWLLAHLARAPIAARLDFTAETALRAAVALGPPLVLLAAALRTAWVPLVRLREQVRTLVGELFARASLAELAAVALAAGVGEELLFRGGLQPLAERWWGPWPAVLAVSLLFGAAHAMSAAYFVVAALMGAYLGWLAQAWGDLVAPIAVHAAYDFLALIALRKGSGATDRGSAE